MTIRLNRRRMKWVALTTMTIDHLAGDFIRTYPDWKEQLLVLRVIGRWAFPLFAFQLALSFRKTSDLPKMIRNLMALALLSEVPFDLRATGKLFSLGGQNVVWNFVLVGVALWLTREGKRRFASRWHEGYTLAVYLVCGLLAHFGRVDYGFQGFLMTLLMAIATNESVIHLAPLVLFDRYWVRFGVLFVPLLLYGYDERPLRFGRWEGEFYHYFYPIHLWLLYAVFRYMMTVS